MTDRQAKEILLLYRPHSADANDPEFAEALARVEQSHDLKIWFEQHCAVQEAIRSKLRQIAAPDGLKEQIVSEYNAQVASQKMQRKVLAVAATAMLLIVGIFGGLWLNQRAQIAKEESFATYRSRMVRSVLLPYNMDLETNNLSQIRSYLSQRQAAADWTLSPALEQTTTTGCGVLNWQGKPVSMVCFRTGRTTAQAGSSDLFLFVVESDQVRNAPADTAPAIAQVNGLLTASWSANGRTYVLAVEGDEKLLRRYL